jgi:NAD(P)-dependent dehydrogenase (short-subunit alcohol dehydrogenase family)
MQGKDFAGPAMTYFVTGGTGFIGRHVIAELVSFGEPVYVLIRPASRSKLDRVLAGCGSRTELIIPIEGDVGEPLAGVAAREVAALKGKIRHFFHLAALYDLDAQAPELERANVLGTRNALDLASKLGTSCFHHMSSIAVAGRFRGEFSEAMFEEAVHLEHPYFRTKHEAERLVRANDCVPWRIYRPGMVVGHSQTGVIDKIDGPYYLFKLIQKLRNSLPSWLPLPGFKGGHINLVPVNYVATATVRLAHIPGEDGRCFHLTDPTDRRIGDVLNLFAQAAHAPQMSLQLEPRLLETAAALASSVTSSSLPVARIINQVLQDIGIPRSIVDLLDYPTVFDATHTQSLLAAEGVALPQLEQYAWRLWDYWERCLDPALHESRNLCVAVKDKTVLITGGSSGIGRATALKLAEAGARVLIVARDPVKLDKVRAEVEQRGGQVGTYACDLADPADCERFLKTLRSEHGHVDILINNAGRSIRRAIDNSYDRMHDYERLMKINYFAAVRVTLGLLPAMVEAGAGTVVLVSSIGVLTNAARFAGYNASKAALEAFARCAAGEYNNRGIRFSIVNLPLVRTPMVAPTRIFERFPLIEPDKAADMVCSAVVHRPERLATRLGILAQFVELLMPGLNRAIMSEAFRIFPESAAACGTPDSGLPEPESTELAACASLMRAMHG